MKKVVAVILMLILLVGCTDTGVTEPLESQTEETQESNETAETTDKEETTEEADNDTVSEETTSEEVVNEEVVELVFPTYPDYVQDLFQGDWTSPGMVNEDGSVYESPAPNATTGVQLNVLDFGAVADDPNFDSTESFQKAIDAANPGDEVYIPAGTFYFTTASLQSNSYTAHIVLKSQVNFIGAGMEETILMSKFSGSFNEKYKTTVLLSMSQSDMVISGFSITSDTDDSRLPDPDVSNLNTFVETAPVYGITLDNDKPVQSHGNIVIEDVLVEKYQRMGMRVRTLHDIRVLNCVFQKATDLGGGGAGYGISIQGMSNGTDLTNSNLDTVHNVVEGCTVNGPYMRHGILLQYYAHNNLITNNVIKDTLLDAIDLHGEDEYSNEVSYNEVINTRRGAAIGLGNSGATHDATGPNNYIHHNTITGGDRGIDIIYGTPYTVIAENTITGIDNHDGTGLFIQNGHNTRIINNVISDFSGEESLGMRILYSYSALEPEVGIPTGYIIKGNTIANIQDGFYIEAHTDDYTYENNTIEEVRGTDYLDENDLFSVPPISDVVIPRIGDILYPSDDNFITNEKPGTAQTQSNMKFKSSYHDVPYNRMVYLKFDLSEMPTNKDNVYLKFTAKSKDGLVTIDIYGSETYTDWSEKDINWNNALYHEPDVAKVLDPNNELDYVTDFTFTTVGTEFNTYYVDVTDYIKNLQGQKVTFILANDQVQNMYCEIYSKDTSADDNKLSLLFSND